MSETQFNTDNEYHFYRRYLLQEEEEKAQQEEEERAEASSDIGSVENDAQKKRQTLNELNRQGSDEELEKQIMEQQDATSKDYKEKMLEYLRVKKEEKTEISRYRVVAHQLKVYLQQKEKAEKTLKELSEGDQSVVKSGDTEKQVLESIEKTIETLKIRILELKQEIELKKHEKHKIEEKIQELVTHGKELYQQIISLEKVYKVANKLSELKKPRSEIVQETCLYDTENVGIDELQDAQKSRHLLDLNGKTQTDRLIDEDVASHLDANQHKHKSTPDTAITTIVGNSQLCSFSSDIVFAFSHNVHVFMID